MLCVEGKLIGALLTFFERPQHCQKCCLSGSIFFLPWVTKKTKINAHELEALRFFFPRSEHTQNTHYRQGALGWATASRWATASQRQGRAGGRAGCTLCGCGWLRACTHAPCEHQLLAVRRADERSGPDMLIFGSRLAFKRLATDRCV